MCSAVDHLGAITANSSGARGPLPLPATFCHEGRPVTGSGWNLGGEEEEKENFCRGGVAGGKWNGVDSCSIGMHLILPPFFLPFSLTYS